MKPFDVAKFRKGIQKSIPGISEGFNDPQIWLDTGCYAANYLISGRFDGGIPLEGKFVTIAGSSGSGKSYIAAANIVKDAQKKGIFPIILDSENALDEVWLQKLGVDTSPDSLLKLNVSMVDEVSKIISSFIDSYKAEWEGTPVEELPGVLFVIDSLGMLLTPTDFDQYEKGDMKGDMGRKAKSLTALARGSIARIGRHKIGIVATNHTYASQDMFSPDSVVAGGAGLIYASSIVINLDQRKLKDGSDILGIRAALQVRKSRYAKPFEKIEIQIPYKTGMDPYSGLFELFEKKGIIEKEGNRYKYISPVTGEEFKDWRKNYGPEIFNTIMAEFHIFEEQEDAKVGFDLYAQEGEESE